MNQLSEKDAQDWMNLLAEAVKYDVAQRRHTRVSAEEFAEAFTRIFYTVPVADRAFVKQKLTEQFEGKAVSVSDAARAAELIYASALLNSIPFGVHYLDEVATLANKNERPNPKLIRETAPEFVPNVARVRVVSDEEAAAFTKQFGGKGDGRKVSTSETFTLPLKK